MDPKGLVVTKNAYFSLLIHIKQLLLVTICDTTAGNGSVMGWDSLPMEGQTDLNVERVM